MVESFTKKLGIIIVFTNIPNKKLVEQKNLPCVWPQFGDHVIANIFYSEYSSAEGWVGDGYLMMWPREEVLKLESIINESFDRKYHFFASDGSGTQFGFFDDGEKIIYISAPDIGDEGDIKPLGAWQSFIESVKRNEYI